MNQVEDPCIYLFDNENLRRWTAHLVKKLWLVAFDIWDHRCKLSHKNDLYNKLHNLQQIDRDIRKLIKVDTIELYPHERRVCYATEAHIFAQTPKFRKEWLLKANNVYQTYLTRLASPIPYKKERSTLQRWLQVIPRLYVLCLIVYPLKGQINNTTKYSGSNLL